MAPHVTRILVPTDFSETADAALEYAKTLATNLGASVHLLHVFQDPNVPAAYSNEVFVPPPDLREHDLAAARTNLLKRMSPEDEKRFAGTHAIVEGLTAKELFVPPPDLREHDLAAARTNLLKRMSPEDEKRFAGTHAIVEGLTAKEIVKYAEQYAIDLIVMGTHGRRRVAHLLLGSVAEHVVRTARCPVLTVRHAEG